jgi:hypothetical protein
LSLCLNDRFFRTTIHDDTRAFAGQPGGDRKSNPFGLSPYSEYSRGPSPNRQSAIGIGIRPSTFNFQRSTFN